MIAGIFHLGSGIGNQLFRYVAARSLAEAKGYGFGMIAPELSKVASFMNLEMGGTSIPYHIEYPAQKVVAKSSLPIWEEKTNYYNPEFNFVVDNTIIDGEFQDERYFDLGRVDHWLRVEPLEMPDDLCVIGFRGGEFALYPHLFLTREYWAEAKLLMLQHNINMRFEVHTDDPQTARQFFPDLECIHDAGFNWRSMRYAKYAIIANSSFYILPRLLSGGMTIAPRYWGRRNTKEWNMPQNYYKKFIYV